MRLVLAKSTFDHPLDDRTVQVGETLTIPDSVAQELNGSFLTEPPMPEIHNEVQAGPSGGEGLVTRLYHKGGGSYLVTDANGKVLNEDTTLRGEDQAREFASSYSSDSNE